MKAATEKGSWEAMEVYQSETMVTTLFVFSISRTSNAIQYPYPT